MLPKLGVAVPGRNHNATLNKTAALCRAAALPILAATDKLGDRFRYV